ncbi:acyltransferase [Paraglaciecola sp.]|uniref:acyltransferase family protein n=1 Tax=Paraglaciecola sp. TaxID=1920173 RepID=UPI003266F77C
MSKKEAPNYKMEPKLHKTFYIPSLNGIRALAFILVYLSHVGLGHIIPGGFGVTVFFFLSGYLITTLLRMEYEKTSSISLKHFYLRRTYRIFPPMYITLFVGVLFSIVGLSSKEFDTAGLIAQMLHFTNYYLILVGSDGLVPSTSIYWSLAIEEHFYLVFPLALLSLIKGRSYQSIAAVLTCLCVLVLVWRCILVMVFDVGHDYIYHASDTRLDSLIFGCILGLWGNPMLEKNSFLDQQGSTLKMSLIILTCCGAILFCFLFRNEVFRETFRYSIQGIALFPLFYYAIKQSHWKIFSILEYAPIKWIGILSYTLYLSHLLALSLAGSILWDNPSPILKACIAFLIALLFSVVMYKFVEKPFARLRKRLHDS